MSFVVLRRSRTWCLSWADKVCLLFDNILFTPQFGCLESHTMKTVKESRDIVAVCLKGRVTLETRGHCPGRLEPEEPQEEEEVGAKEQLLLEWRKY